MNRFKGTDEIVVEFIRTNTIQVFTTVGNIKRALNSNGAMIEPKGEFEDVTEYVYALLSENPTVSRDAFLLDLNGDVMDEDVSIEEVIEP